jgi:hypothetical protein
MTVTPEATVTPDPDPLAGFDTILAEVAHREVESDERTAHQVEINTQFLADFNTACHTQVQPAMETVLARLTEHGGGGVIEAHPGGEARFRNPSLILWMSLEGPLVGHPRPDRDPYLQLEADVAGHEIHVYEGDMWRGAGGNRSGRTGTWELSQLTGERIVAELLDIAQRSSQGADGQS